MKLSLHARQYATMAYFFCYFKGMYSHVNIRHNNNGATIFVFVVVNRDRATQLNSTQLNSAQRKSNQI